MESDSQQVGDCARVFFLSSSCNSVCPSCCSHFRSGGTGQQVGCWLTDQETDPWAGTRGFMRNVAVAKSSWRNVAQKATTPLILIAGSNWKPKWHKYLSTFLPKHSWVSFSFPKIWHFVSNWLQIYVDRVGIPLCGNSSFGSDKSIFGQSHQTFLSYLSLFIFKMTFPNRHENIWSLLFRLCIMLLLKYLFHLKCSHT